MDKGIEVRVSKFMERIKPSTPLKLLVEIVIRTPRQWRNLILGCPIEIISDSETLALLAKGHSFVRWGDGETALGRGKSIFYQEYDRELKEKLEHLVKNPPRNTIIGVPWVIYSSWRDPKWNKRIFKIMFSTRVYWSKNLKEQIENVIFSRTEFWWDLAPQLKSLMNKIVSSNSRLVLIGDEKFLALCPDDTKHLSIPNLDAFSHYETLAKSVQEILDSGSGRVTLLVAAGPTTKALVNDFANKCQVIDVGHGFNFALGGRGAWAWQRDNK